MWNEKDLYNFLIVFTLIVLSIGYGLGKLLELVF